MKTEDVQNLYNVKVSFIVPVYKVEKYISRCIKSIMSQSYSNIEIILVDDGSPDSCGKIMDQLAETDKRIQVIHQQNAGVSEARNSGLRVATGDYITFVDGDDFIESDYTDYFLSLMSYDDVQMAVGLKCFTIDSNKQTVKDVPVLWKDIKVIEGIYLGKIQVAVWNKMYKRSIIQDHNICFHSDIWYGEGMLFNIEYLQYVKLVATGGQKVYHQIYNPNSAMRNFNLNSNLCGIRSMKIQRNLWTKYTEQIEKAWKYHYRNFSRSILNGLIATNTVNENKELYNRCKRAMRKDMLLPWQVDIPLNQKIKLTIFSLMPYMVAVYSKRKGIRAVKKQEKFLNKESKNEWQ